MKKHELYTALQQIEPDEHMQERLRQKVIHPQKKRPVLRYITAACLAAACLISVWVVADRNAQQPAPTQAESGAFMNSFSIRVYAADRANDDSNAAAVQPDFQLTTLVPQAKIERGKLYTYEDNGKTISAYEASYGGGQPLTFEVVGDRIKTVTVSSQNGYLTHWDFQLMHEMQESGAYYAAQFTLPADSMTGADQTLPEQFEKLWESGALDAYKNMYFKGKSTELHDYARYSVKRLESGEIEVCFVTEETLAQIHQYGQTVTMRGQAGSNVQWLPQAALDKVMEYPAIPFEELPKDIIILEAEFEDGTIQTKSIEIWFDKDGNTLMQEIA